MTGYTVIIIAMYGALLTTNLGAVQITGTQKDSNGTPFSGLMTVRRHVATGPTQDVLKVSVTGGKVNINLLPNDGGDPLDNYEVRFKGCNGEFIQVWVVPVANTLLDLANVRSAVGSTPTRGLGGVSSDEPALTGRSMSQEQADLARRPVMGAGFGTGAVAMINLNGQIETVVGDAGECVLIDGTATPCRVWYVDDETPAGTLDGMNQTFQLAKLPEGSSLKLFRNGLLMKASSDYTQTGSTIQFINGVIPVANDTLLASYRVAPGTGTARAITAPPRPERHSYSPAFCGGSLTPSWL